MNTCYNLTDKKKPNEQSDNAKKLLQEQPMELSSM